MKRSRRDHAREIRTEAAVPAIGGDKTLAGLTQQCNGADTARDRHIHCRDCDHDARRPHQVLGRLAPDRALFGSAEPRLAA